MNSGNSPPAGGLPIAQFFDEVDPQSVLSIIAALQEGILALDGDLRLLTTLANSMSVALENARLFGTACPIADCGYVAQLVRAQHS